MNCNCSSSTIKLPISEYVEDTICQKQPDIAILTEIVIDKNTKYPGYKVCPSPRNYYQDNSRNLANQVVIAVKKGITVTDEVTYPYEPSVHFPDCHWIKIKVGGKQCNIIGFRMPAVKSYYERKCLFDKFVKYVESKIQPGEVTMLAGDFNNAQCHGPLDKSFNAVKSCYYNKDGEQLPQYPYNLHYINDSFGTMGLKLIDMDNNKSWPYRDRTNKLCEPCIPDDHIFISSGTKAEVTFYPENLYDKKYPLDHKYFIADVTL